MTAKRFQILDLTRGIAIALMLIYHLSFGLSQLGYLNVDFSNDVFWVSFRALIVFLFLSLVGVGLCLANINGLKLKAYFKRLALLLVYASLITWLSKTIRAEHYVYFGILHLILISSILGLLFVRLYWISLLVGISTILCGLLFQIPALNQQQFHWIGMNNFPHYADDFAPVFPWFGLVLIGIFIAQNIFVRNKFKRLENWQPTHWTTQLVCWSGRYSIHIYFIHFQMFYLLVYLFA